MPKNAAILARLEKLAALYARLEALTRQMIAQAGDDWKIESLWEKKAAVLSEIDTLEGGLPYRQAPEGRVIDADFSSEETKKAASLLTRLAELIGRNLEADQQLKDLANQALSQAGEDLDRLGQGLKALKGYSRFRGSTACLISKKS